MSANAVEDLEAAIRARAEHRRLGDQLGRLDSRLAEAEERAAQTRSRLAEEESDVARLEKISPTRLWATFKGSRGGDLDRERAEADRARYEAQRAQADLDRLRREAEGLRAQRDALGDVEAAHERALAATVRAAEADPSLRGVAGDAERQLGHILERREVEEALAAGHEARTSLLEARETLGRADDWSAWDTWGGGDVFSSYMKHQRLDEVTDQLQSASAVLDRFSRELADVDLPGVDAPVVDGLSRGIDIFFDNIFTDLSVRSRIKEAAAQLDDAIEKVSAAILELERRRTRLIS